MTTVEQLGNELAVDPADIRVLIEQMLDVHDKGLSDVLATEVWQLLNPAGSGTRPIGCGTSPPSTATAASALLDELEMHGQRRIVHALTIERLLQDPSERER